MPSSSFGERTMSCAESSAATAGGSREAHPKRFPRPISPDVHIFIADGRTHDLSGRSSEQSVSVVALGHRLVAARHGIVYLHAEALQRPDRQRLVGEDHRERCVASEPFGFICLRPKSARACFGLSILPRKRRLRPRLTRSGRPPGVNNASPHPCRRLPVRRC